MPPFSPTPEREERYDGPDLEQLLQQHEQLLTHLAQPDHPLTLSRLKGNVAFARTLVAEAEVEGIAWPTQDTAVPSRLESRHREYFVADAERSDAHFAYGVIEGQRARAGFEGFNNFPALLRSKPYKPEGVDDFRQVMALDPASALYGSKPYLLRAYMIAPEFMAALQESVEGRRGASKWSEAMIRGGLEPDIYPEDAVLLRSSRLAYGLLTNLIRTDDLQRQSEWIGFGKRQQVIDDTHHELWT